MKCSLSRCVNITLAAVRSALHVWDLPLTWATNAGCRRYSWTLSLSVSPRPAPRWESTCPATVLTHCRFAGSKAASLLRAGIARLTSIRSQVLKEPLSNWGFHGWSTLTVRTLLARTRFGNSRRTVPQTCCDIYLLRKIHDWKVARIFWQAIAMRSSAASILRNGPGALSKRSEMRRCSQNMRTPNRLVL